MIHCTFKYARRGANRLVFWRDCPCHGFIVQGKRVSKEIDRLVPKRIRKAYINDIRSNTDPTLNLQKRLTIHAVKKYGMELKYAVEYAQKVVHRVAPYI